MKRFLFLFFFISFFSFSQEEIPVIDFTKQDYLIGKKVRINFDKDWRPTINIDSALYYRLITFKEKNIPAGRIEDYYRNGIMQGAFYSSYVGLDSKGIDSLVANGPMQVFFENGNKKWKMNFFNDMKVGEEIGYYESGEVEYTVNHIDGLAQGEVIFYYKSGEISLKFNSLDGLQQGEQIEYKKNGEITKKYFDKGKPVEDKVEYYYESGEVEYTTNYKEGIPHGEQIYFYKSGEVEYTVNYIDGLVQGEEIHFYKSGEVEIIQNNIDDLLQGEEIWYYKSGEVEIILNYIDDLQQGEEIWYYKPGEVEITLNYIDDLQQGEEIGYYESGEVEYTVNYIDGLAQGEQVFYLKNGEIDYNQLWINDKIKVRKIALVIGNADYDKGKLSNPVNDANLIAESLEKLDFEVYLHENLATRREMGRAIQNFGRKRKDYEIAFVYYAGHGIQLNNQNYLLPVKENFEHEDDVEFNAISVQRVLSYLESTREGQLNFIVLDACRDNPFEQNWNKTRSLKGGGLAKIPPPKGSLIAFSTDHGQTAADGDGENSLYSQALASMMLEEDVSIEQVFKNVRTEVLKLSNNEQSPVEESKLTGDAFYLNKKIQE